MSQVEEQFPNLLKQSYTTHKLPCNMQQAQSCTINYKNEDTIFIFGAYNNNSIYKYNKNSLKYELYDKYNNKN